MKINDVPLTAVPSPAEGAATDQAQVLGRDSPGEDPDRCDRDGGAEGRDARCWATFWLRLVEFLGRGRNRLSVICSGQAGTSTAEYAIATLAAVAFAGLLVVIMRSDEVRGFLLNIIRTALAIP